MGDYFESDNASNTALTWSLGEREAVSEVEGVLDANGHGFETITAVALTTNLDTIERIDKLIATYNHRRDSAIRELEKRRDSITKRARQIVDAAAMDLADVDAAE